MQILFYFLKNIYLFIFKERGGEGERERNINVWVPLMCPPPRTQPTTQACALNRQQTCNPFVHRSALNPLSHTIQGRKYKF